MIIDHIDNEAIDNHVCGDIIWKVVSFLTFFFRTKFVVR